LDDDRSIVFSQKLFALAVWNRKINDRHIDIPVQSAVGVVSSKQLFIAIWLLRSLRELPSFA
jgi:hypothetical protein